LHADTTSSTSAAATDKPADVEKTKKSGDGG
jgi:hypothetical protein